MLDQQPLLGPEVIVEEAAAYARLARHVLKGGAGGAALGDALAHRVDDALRLFPAQLALFGCSLHESSLRRGRAYRPAAAALRAVYARRAGVLELLLGAEEGIQHGLASVLADHQRDHAGHQAVEDQAGKAALLVLTLAFTPT